MIKDSSLDDEDNNQFEAVVSSNGLLKYAGVEFFPFMKCLDIGRIFGFPSKCSNIGMDRSNDGMWDPGHLKNEMGFPVENQMVVEMNRGFLQQDQQ